MLTDERKSELRAIWNQTPNGGCIAATDDEMVFLRTLGATGYQDRAFKEAAVSPDETWPRPIPVSERLPEENLDVLVFYERAGDWICGSWRGGEWLTCSPSASASAHITHWLPLPPKPE